MSYKQLVYTPGPWTVGGSLVSSPKATVALVTIRRLDRNGSAVGTLDVARAALAKAEARP